MSSVECCSLSMLTQGIPCRRNVLYVPSFAREVVLAHHLQLYLALCDRRGGKASVTADVNGVVRNACSVKGTLSRGRTGIVVNVVNSRYGKHLLFI